MPPPANPRPTFSSSQANESTDKPLRIAAIVEVSADLSQFTADKVADGTLYRLAVQSPGALGLGKPHPPPSDMITVQRRSGQGIQQARGIA